MPDRIIQSEYDYEIKCMPGGKARLRLLTPSQRHEALGMEVEGGQTVLNPDMDKLVRWGTVRITDVSVNGKPIESGEALCRTQGLDDVYEELGIEILTANMRQDEKNSG